MSASRPGAGDLWLSGYGALDGLVEPGRRLRDIAVRHDEQRGHGEHRAGDDVDADPGAGVGRVHDRGRDEGCRATPSSSLQSFGYQKSPTVVMPSWSGRNGLQIRNPA